MKRAIGAIAVYDDPEKGRVAFLQVRKADDSYPGCVEKTWGGGVEDGERFSEAVCREYGEELRECIRRALGQNAQIPQELTGLQKKETDQVMTEEPSEATVDSHTGKYVLRRLNVLRQEGKKLVVTLLCEILDPAVVSEIQPMIDAGVLIPLTAGELDRLTPIAAEHKHTGIPVEERQEGKLGMFPDEIEAVTRVLTV